MFHVDESGLPSVESCFVVDEDGKRTFGAFSELSYKVSEPVPPTHLVAFLTQQTASASTLSIMAACEFVEAPFAPDVPAGACRTDGRPRLPLRILHPPLEGRVFLAGDPLVVAVDAHPHNFGGGTCSPVVVWNGATAPLLPLANWPRDALFPSDPDAAAARGGDAGSGRAFAGISHAGGPIRVRLPPLAAGAASLLVSVWCSTCRPGIMDTAFVAHASLVVVDAARIPPPPPPLTMTAAAVAAPLIWAVAKATPATTPLEAALLSGSPALAALAGVPAWNPHGRRPPAGGVGLPAEARLVYIVDDPAVGAAAALAGGAEALLGLCEAGGCLAALMLEHLQAGGGVEVRWPFGQGEDTAGSGPRVEKGSDASASSGHPSDG
jgi:hypothetical protein